MSAPRTLPFYVAAALAASTLLHAPIAYAATEDERPSQEEAAHIVKEVALTFDDGPYGTSTQQILDILKKENVPATFFLIGKNVEQYPNEVKEIVAQGNEIGNHTYSHAWLDTLTTRQGLAEVAKAETAIHAVVGGRTHLMRPPYGVMSIPLQKALEKRGYEIVMWNVDPKDWDAGSTSPEQIIERVTAEEKPHMVIVMHDGRDTHVNYSRKNLIDALPKLIEMLKSKGYLFTYPDAFRGELQHPFRPVRKKRAG